MFMIYKFDSFWSYIGNETYETMDSIKTLLSRQDYDYEDCEFKTTKLYVPHNNILGIETIKIPTGLCEHIQKTFNLEIEHKHKEYKKYTKKDILEIAKPIQLINPSFEIRDYQLQSVLVASHRYQSLVYFGVGTGKASCLGLLCLLHKNKKILIMNNSNFILTEIYNRLLSLGVDKTNIGTGTQDLSKPIIIINTATSYNRIKENNSEYINYLKNVEIICQDECFSGNTEILTNEGWKSFEKLNGDELFANFKADTQEIYFSKGEIIKKPFNEKIVKFNTHRKSNIIMTPGHEQLYISENGKIQKKPIKDLRTTNNKSKIFCSGYGTGKKQKLTNIEKMLIAIQANGHTVNRGKRNSYEIAFAKDKKIKYWTELYNVFNGKKSIIKPQKTCKYRSHVWIDGYENGKAKKLYDCFNLVDFSYECANEFINEVIKWDGWQQSKNVYGYVSGDKKNTDFVAAVAFLGGYSAYQEEMIDKRPNNNPTYRVFLTKKKYKSLQNTHKEYVDYNNNVYCVNVPEHNIIVRNSKTKQYSFATGNCQHSQSASHFIPLFYASNLKHFVGYSGSPYKKPNDIYNNTDDLVLTGIIGEPAIVYQMKDSIKENTIAQPYSYFINYKPWNITLPEQTKYFIHYRKGIVYNRNRNNAGIAMIKYLNNNNIKTLVLFREVKNHGLKVLKQLKKDGVNALFLQGGNKIHEYDSKLNLNTKKGEVEDIKVALKNNYNIILASGVLNEGVDIDVFQAGILFTGGVSAIQIVQQSGRVSRKKKIGENIALIVDFKDEEINYLFKKQYLTRKKILQDNGVIETKNVQEFFDIVNKIKG